MARAAGTTSPFRGVVPNRPPTGRRRERRSGTGSTGAVAYATGWAFSRTWRRDARVRHTAKLVELQRRYDGAGRSCGPLGSVAKLHIEDILSTCGPRMRRPSALRR